MVNTGFSNGALTVSDAATTRTNLNVPSTTGSGASGTWPISISGSSGSVPNPLTVSTGLALNSGTTYDGSSAKTITIDSTVATLTGSQALTNKTISGSSNTLSNIGNSSLTNSSLTANGTSIALGASGTVPVNTTSTATNASFFPLFVSSSSNGNQSVNLGTGLTFNPSSNNLSTTTFTGALSGNATTATSATNIGITNDTTTNSTMFPLWVTANSGNLPAKVTSSKLTFNPSTGVLSSTSFTGAGTGLSGTAASLTAGNVTTNANLTGVITSVGNATSIASQTGTGTKFVVDTSPTLVTPNIGTPSAGVLTNCTGLPSASVNSALVNSYSPTLGNGTTNFTVSSSGAYINLAGMTFFRANIDWSNKNSVTTALVISLPSTPSVYVSCTVGYTNGMPTTGDIYAVCNGGSPTVQMWRLNSGSGANLLGSEVGNSGSIWISGWYY